MTDAGASYSTVWLPKVHQTLGSDAPRSLWYRGNLAALAGPAVGIVGSRTCDLYGDLIARRYAAVLASHGVTVVSGFAKGIDAAAHHGAAKVRGRTVAVFGCGIDSWYPARHANLGEMILASGGLCLSEYGIGVEPAPWRFPARNRIVAALSDVLVVVEARERSGSLITAEFALNFGRPILVCRPEQHGTHSLGSDKLVADRIARYIDTPYEIMETLEEEVPRWKPQPSRST